MLRILAIFLWLTFAIVAALILTMPVSVEAHLLESAVVIASLVLIKCLDPDTKFRSVFLALGTALVIQYAIWRLTSTLPSPSSQLKFGSMLVSRRLCRNHHRR